MARKLPNIIIQEDFEKLINANILQEKKSKIENYKKRLVEYRISMLLGFESGLRISEIVGYSINGVIIVPTLKKENIEEKWIRIISGKGKKDRITRRPKRLTNKAVLMFPLSIRRRSLQYYFTKLGEKILGKHITFHTLRHGFCSHLANEGQPLHEIQMMAGHSRLDTTGIYLHARPEGAIKRADEIF